MTPALKISGFVVLSLMLFTSGTVVGRRQRAHISRIAPVEAELTLDTKYRPATLKQFVTTTRGERLLHGQQFEWEWHDEPLGCIAVGLQIHREDYEAGELRGSAMWNDPSVTLTPGKNLDPAILTKYPDER